MGTRSITHFKVGDIDSTTLVSMYRQFDGYPRGHGRDIAGFMSNKIVYNGYPMTAYHDFNGMGDVAAQVIAHLKTMNYPIVEREALDGSMYLTTDRMVEPSYTEPRIGNARIVEPNATDHGEEYVYTVYLESYPDEETYERGTFPTEGTGGIFIKVEDTYENKTLFDGSIEDALREFPTLER